MKVISVFFPFAVIAFDEGAVDAALADSTKITTLRSLFFTERRADFACWCRDPKVHTVFTLEMALTLFILFLLPLIADFDLSSLKKTNIFPYFSSMLNPIYLKFELQFLFSICLITSCWLPPAGLGLL